MNIEKTKYNPEKESCYNCDFGNSWACDKHLEEEEIIEVPRGEKIKMVIYAVGFIVIFSFIGECQQRANKREAEKDKQELIKELESMGRIYHRKPEFKN
jgi:hypothetical protein